MIEEAFKDSDADGSERPESSEQVPATDEPGLSAPVVARESTVGRKTRPDTANRPPAAANGKSKGFRVEDVIAGAKDSRGIEIQHVYARQSNEYAVYKAGDVIVQFADDPERTKAQRQSLLCMEPMRAELNSLLMGWKGRKTYDAMIAYALQLALENNAEGGKAALTSAKTNLLAEREAAGRFQYLTWAFAAGVALLGILSVASLVQSPDNAATNIWLATKAGLVGAIFSIAIGVRSRTVALDTNLRDNISDGVLRLLIGVISGGVLFLMFAAGIVPSIKVGDASLSGPAVTWQAVFVLGFIAGFLERLVPDLLEQQSQSNAIGTAATAPAPVATRNP